MLKNIDAIDCFKSLKESKYTILIDVRSINEWKSDGCADLTSINKKPYFISWSEDVFINQIKSLNIESKYTLFFICRTGVRSANAIHALTAENFDNQMFNVKGGMEHGWKVSLLPTQYT